MKRPLEALLQDALHAAIAAGDLRVPEAPACAIEDPELATFGDATCAVARKIARPLGRPALDVARTIVRHVRDPHGWLDAVEAAGPGFINLTASLAFWRTELARVLDAAAPDAREPAAVVTIAAPDDPSAGRVAVVADAIARLLGRVGCRVERVRADADVPAALGTAADRCVVVGSAATGGVLARAKRLRAEAGGDPTTTTIVTVAALGATSRGRSLDAAGVARLLAMDAARFALLGEEADVPVELDVDLLGAERIDNPLFAVRYALVRLARAAGAELPAPDLERLGAAELPCLRLVARHRDVLDLAVRRAEPHLVVAHVRAVAAAAHRYYNRHHPHIGDPRDVAARAAMLRGIGTVLRDGLALAGVRVAEGG
ncbi:MAG TPA: DALR anticodon-binding domain-containing protein [Candidatus Eisenbacteria bacterium]|nr:DALR anticodon-binding domain-containing protein [Candidatus Eisenbacteria bacterium]